MATTEGCVLVHPSWVDVLALHICCDPALRGDVLVPVHQEILAARSVSSPRETSFYGAAFSSMFSCIYH
eukprot:1162634-Amphidinium_carterae.1